MPISHCWYPRRPTALPHEQLAALIWPCPPVPLLDPDHHGERRGGADWGRGHGGLPPRPGLAGLNRQWPFLMWFFRAVLRYKWLSHYWHYTGPAVLWSETCQNPATSSSLSDTQKICQRLTVADIIEHHYSTNISLNFICQCLRYLHFQVGRLNQVKACYPHAYRCSLASFENTKQIKVQTKRRVWKCMKLFLKWTCASRVTVPVLTSDHGS